MYATLALQLLFLLFALSGKVWSSDDILFPYGTENGDQEGPFVHYSDPVNLTIPIKFFKKKYDQLSVCTNGLVSFGGEYCTLFPEKLPTTESDFPFIALFWLQQNAITDGNMNYWYYNWRFKHEFRYNLDYFYSYDDYVRSERQNDKVVFRVTSDPDLLQQASKVVEDNYPGCPDDFTPKELFIVTWVETQDIDFCEELGIADDPDMCECVIDPPFPEHAPADYYYEAMIDYCHCHLDDDVTDWRECWGLVKRDIHEMEATGLLHTQKRSSMESNTYQLVLMTNGFHSFAMLNYKEIGWVSTVSFHAKSKIERYWAAAGFNREDGSWSHTLPYSGTPEMYNLATDSNINVPGRWLYRINRRKLIGPGCKRVRRDPLQ